MTPTMILSALVCFLGAIALAMGIIADRMREQRDAARVQLESLRALHENAIKHAQTIPRWVAITKVLLALVKHRPFDHDYIKDEKACKTCADIKGIQKMIAEAERLYGYVRVEVEG